MSWATWTADMRHLAAVDRQHRTARQGAIIGRQLVPIGKISTFLTVCFAIGIGSLMLLPVDSDVPANVPAIAGAMLMLYAPFAGVWMKLTDFERLHAPPAGLLLLRLRRLSPFLFLIGALWGAMLWRGGGNGVAIAAVAVMPFALSVGNMLRHEFAGLVLRGAIAATFIIGWIDLVPWLPVVTLGLVCMLIAWFVRDLGIYDRSGFALDVNDGDRLADVRAQIAAERELPNVRATSRRSLFGSARFLTFAGQRDLPALWKHKPLLVTISNVIVVMLWLTPIWLAIAAVCQSDQNVAAVWCLLSALVSAALFTVEPNEQLYLWGTDMREIDRQNMLARLLTVALPAVVAGAIVAAAFDVTGARWSAVLLLCGTHLARSGSGAFNIPTRALILAGVVAVLLSCGKNQIDPDLANWSSAALLAYGVAGIVIRCFRNEDTLRKHAFA